MPEPKERPKKALETRVSIARLAYIDAFTAWERMLHLANCASCRPEQVSEAEHEFKCAIAAAEKERCRRVLSDLLDELGYVPQIIGGGALPDQEQRCGRPH